LYTCSLTQLFLRYSDASEELKVSFERHWPHVDVEHPRKTCDCRHLPGTFFVRKATPAKRFCTDLARSKTSRAALEALRFPASSGFCHAMQTCVHTRMTQQLL